jgi:hypothetical protein
MVVSTKSFDRLKIAPAPLDLGDEGQRLAVLPVIDELFLSQQKFAKEPHVALPPLMSYNYFHDLFKETRLTKVGLAVMGLANVVSQQDDALYNSVDTKLLVAQQPSESLLSDWKRGSSRPVMWASYNALKKLMKEQTGIEDTPPNNRIGSLILVSKDELFNLSAEEGAQQGGNSPPPAPREGLVKEHGQKPDVQQQPETAEERFAKQKTELMGHLYEYYVISDTRHMAVLTRAEFADLALRNMVDEEHLIWRNTGNKDDNYFLKYAEIPERAEIEKRRRLLQPTATSASEPMKDKQPIAGDYGRLKKAHASQVPEPLNNANSPLLKEVSAPAPKANAKKPLTEKQLTESKALKASHLWPELSLN